MTDSFATLMNIITKILAEITSVTEEGVLQKSFKLPERTKEGGITFADGAMDGIYIYHTAHSPLGEPEKEEIGKQYNSFVTA